MVSRPSFRSALKAFERAARESGVDATTTLSADADHVAKADRIVLPGVGALPIAGPGSTPLTA